MAGGDYESATPSTKMKLWKKVIIGLVLGVVAGLVMGKDAEMFKFLGTIFISLIKMIVIPLIFLALVSGITAMGGSDNFKRVGIKSVLAFLTTAALAVCIGLGAGYLLEPGKGIELHLKNTVPAAAAPANTSLATVPAATADANADGKTTKLEKAKADAANASVPGVPAPAPAAAAPAAPIATGHAAPAATPPTVPQMLLSLIPTNIFRAATEDNILQIVIFAVFVGITLNLTAPRSNRVIELVQDMAQVAFKMIELIVQLAPYGVFGFISWLVGTQGMDVIYSLAKLVVAVIGACLVQYLLFGVFLAVFGRVSPFPFYRKLLETQSLAFSTSSSKATLSTAMRVAHEKLGVSRPSCNFVLPLGASINMDGTAIYLGICALFFAQATGTVLTGHDYLVLVLTCTIASIGAAGIPSGSLLFMGMVLSSVGLPIEGIAIIAGVDRILDMVRTTINITGDTAITVIIDSSEKQLDEKVYYS